MRLYLSGPMTGLPNFNRHNFATLRNSLRAKGHFVLDPTELDSVPSSATSALNPLLWRNFIMRDVAMLMSCELDAIVVLEGWERSRGARIEVLAAMLAGLAVLDAQLRPLWVEGIDTVDLNRGADFEVN